MSALAMTPEAILFALALCVAGLLIAAAAALLVRRNSIRRLKARRRHFVEQFAPAIPPRPIPIAVAVSRSEITSIKADAHRAAAVLLCTGQAVPNPHKAGTRRAIVWDTFYLDATMTSEWQELRA
jgi:hypothetical protein